MKKKILTILGGLTLTAFLFISISSGLNTNSCYDISFSFLKAAVAEAENGGGGSMPCWSSNSSGVPSFQLNVRDVALLMFMLIKI
jgi:hypothetical protein